MAPGDSWGQGSWNLGPESFTAHLEMWSGEHAGLLVSDSENREVVAVPSTSPHTGVQVASEQTVLALLGGGQALEQASSDPRSILCS